MKPRDIDPDELSGALNGRFKISGVLGSGSQGVVFHAIRERALDGSDADDLVALKLYLDTDEDERVEREVIAMQRIRHPTLADLIEFGQVELGRKEVRYCAWEFIQGNPLDRGIQAGPLSDRTVAVIGRDVSLALQAIWTERIVHRDVSPKNIIVRAGEREAVLIDLGVARHIGRSSLTQYGMTWGTPGYLSPEQCQAERALTCRSDVFALGIVLIEALRGSHPTGYDQNALLREPRSTANFAPTAPAGLAAIIDPMLNSRAVRRPLPGNIAEAFTRYLEA